MGKCQCLDLFSLNMGGLPSDDPNNDFNRFFDEFKEQVAVVRVVRIRFTSSASIQNPSMLLDNSTFESLFSDDSPQSIQEIPHHTVRSPRLSLCLQIPPLSFQSSPTVPTLSSTPAVVPPITDCIKIQCFTPTIAGATKIVKCEPSNVNRSIRIITTSANPITVASLPAIAIPVVSSKPVNPTSPPIAKRRRSDSPSEHQQVTEVPTVTVEQLKAQYGHMSVSEANVCRTI